MTDEHSVRGTGRQAEAAEADVRKPEESRTYLENCIYESI